MAGVRCALCWRARDASLALSVHSLLLVDALQTYGPDFELLVASHKHVGYAPSHSPHRGTCSPHLNFVQRLPSLFDTVACRLAVFSDRYDYSMDTASGSIRGSEPTSPQSPTSPAASGAFGCAAHPQALSQALFSLHRSTSE